VFDPQFVAHRERFIRARLAAGLASVIPETLLTLRPAPDGTTPMIEVTYSLATSGNLVVATYTSPLPIVDDSGDNKLDKKTVGLIRDYDMQATIAIRPPGYRRWFRQSLYVESSDVTCLNVDENQIWGLYAVILYGEGHDLTRSLLSRFALESPSALKRVVFSEVLPAR
jgi:hypothetical protein